jgi:hypothetical protein
MEPWQERLINEKAELDLKLERLTEFGRSPQFQALDEEEQMLINRQHSLMEDYSEVLSKRIKRFQP